MTTTAGPAALEQVEKALQIGIDVTLRILDRVAHAGLGWIEIAVEIVEPDHGPPLGQELPGDAKADEAGGTRDQNHLIRHPVPTRSLAPRPRRLL